MVGKLNTSSGANPYSISKQTASTNQRDRRTVDTGNVDRIDISIDALRASKMAKPQVYQHDDSADTEEPIEKLLEEYNNSGAISKADSQDDAAAAEARRKMTAMKIAMRISKGDNVPMQDHRFLAEYDSKLYQASLKASLTADNKDPETHESLAEELASYESAKSMQDTQASEEETVDDIASDEISSDEQV